MVLTELWQHWQCSLSTSDGKWQAKQHTITSLTCTLCVHFQLHKAARLPKSDKLAKVHEQWCVYDCARDSILYHRKMFLLPQIEQMRRHRWSAISFNRSWLEDIYEETICELPGERITPLVSNPGRIMLTSARLYFQPYNNVEVVCHRVFVTSESCADLSSPPSPASVPPSLSLIHIHAGPSIESEAVWFDICHEAAIHAAPCGMPSPSPSISLTWYCSRLPSHS